MDWTTIITTVLSLLITGGGLVTIVTLKDKKSEAVLQNLTKMIENTDKTNQEWQEIVRERNEELNGMEAKVGKKDAKIDELFAEQRTLRDRCDNLSSEVAVLKVLRCNIVGCSDRVPPIDAFDALKALDAEMNTVTDNPCGERGGKTTHKHSSSRKGRGTEKDK